MVDQTKPSLDSSSEARMSLANADLNRYRFGTLLRDMRDDFRRYQCMGRNPIVVFCLSQGYWAITTYRISRFFTTNIPMLNVIPRYMARFCQLFIEMSTGVSLPATCDIKAGLLIPHYGPIVINHQVAIGRNCTIHQCVTIGAAGRDDKRGTPVLGDRVFVGANAVIIGRITIGDDAAIGAGAVVTNSVPPRAVVAGNPAQIVSYRGSFGLIRYPGMDDDPDRLASMAEVQMQPIGNS